MEQISLLREFTTDLQTRGISDDSIEQYPVYIRVLYNFVGGNLLEVDEDVLVEYLAHLRKNKLKHNTIRHYFTVISSFYDFLLFKKYITINPVTPMFRRHYLKSFKVHDAEQRRQCLTVRQAKTLVESILDPRERAVVLLLMKTGMRRKELSELNLENVDMENKTIHIKPTDKRSNEIIYFDLETSIILGKWLKQREKVNKNKIAAFFLDRFNNRLSPEAINKIVVKHATTVGLHNPDSDRLEDKLTAHALRHFFTTQMLEGGMPREFVQELRGDSSRSAIDIYYHIDKKKLQKSYLDCVPQFGLI